MKVVAAAAAFVVLTVPSGVLAQGDRSLKDFETVPMGQEITIPSQDDNDSETLAEKLVLAHGSIKALTESLAMANNEAEVFKRKATDLQLKLDAYGLSGLEKEPDKVEQRLLAAVRDLRLLKKQNDDAVNQLVRLSESIQVLIKTSEGINPQSRMTVESEIRKTSEILGAPNAAKAESAEATLTDGMVIDTKEDLSLVVANIGSRQGVRVGMPFQIWRDKRRVGSVRVVDVRDRICGAVIQNLESEKDTVKSGDRLRVDAKE